MLNIKPEDVETWAIEAIAYGVIDAKIDQLKEEIVIKSHVQKEFNKSEWDQLKSSVREWRERFETMQAILQHQ